MERFDIAQAHIAGNDEIGARGERAGEHGVVIGVRRGARDRGGKNGLGERLVEREHLRRGALFAFESAGYVLAREHVGKLSEKFGRAYKLDLAFGREFDQPRRGAGTEDRGNDDIGVKYQTHRA